MCVFDDNVVFNKSFDINAVHTEVLLHIDLVFEEQL